jgi:acyl-CoA synthetase (AMP-forming)/AMP-acid ligase II
VFAISPDGAAALNAWNGRDEARILTYVAERVAPHKRIRHLERLDTIPKSPSGKILRRTLVERARHTSRPLTSKTP